MWAGVPQESAAVHNSVCAQQGSFLEGDVFECQFLRTVIF